LLIQRDDIRNEVFLVADATPVSLPEIIASLRHGMVRPANLFAIPPPLLLGLVRMCRLTETWEKLAGSLVVSVDKLSAIGYSSPSRRHRAGYDDLCAAAFVCRAFICRGFEMTCSMFLKS